MGIPKILQGKDQINETAYYKIGERGVLLHR